MAYASWSVVFGEQPSATKWNILGTNDASFNDGTGFGTRVITPISLTNPYRFRAYLNSAQNNITSGATMQCAVESYDTNSNYDTGTYTYTTPRAGVYHFDAHAQCSADDSRLRADIYIDAVQSIAGSETTKRGSTVSGEFLCTAGQAITFRCASGEAGTTDMATGSNNTFWSGFLVQDTT